MAVLVCDVCGGKLVMGAGGVAVCDSCGMEHSKDRMQEKVQEIKGTVQVSNIASLESLMKRGRLALEDSDWKQADEYFNKVLDIDPEYAPAYVGKLCAELKVRQEELLENNEKPLTEYSLYQKAVRFASADQRAKLEGYNKPIQERILVLAEIRKKNVEFQKCISAGYHTVGLKSDGTIVTVGFNKYGQCNTGSWRNIVAVASNSGTIGLKTDGTVVAVGYNEYGQCNTEGWRDIVAIAAGRLHTVGLKTDGTVVAVGSNSKDQCDTGSWRDIVTIAAGDSHTVGLKVNGTVVTVGDNYCGQCNTESWRDIVTIAAGDSHTVGLKADGTVVAVGKNEDDQCNTGSWRDIIAIAAGVYHTVGLKADGMVVAVGKNKYGQCNTGSWRDIVAIAAGVYHTVGLKADGTVVAVGDNEHGQCNTGSWRDIGPVSEEKRQAMIEEGKRRRLEEQKRIEQSNKWASQGLCRHCGGQLGGLFTKKCKSCGKEN